MRTMYYRVSMLAAWLLFFYNLERVSKFVSTQRIDLLTPYAYVFVALITLITLAVPSLFRLPFPVLTSGGVGLFLVFKPLFGYQLWGAALPITLTEVCTVLVTGILARQVIWAIREFETSIVNFTIKHIGRQTRAFDVEQGDMYQEVRRARAFNRPLTLLAIEPERTSINGAVERMVAEVQQATMKQYVLAALAKRLEDLFGPYSIIAQDGERFLVLLPEQTKENAINLISRLRGGVEEVLNLDLRIGAAFVPEIDMFDELVEAAYADMQSTQSHPAQNSAKKSVISVPEHLISH